MKKFMLFLISILFCGKLFAAEINKIIFFGDSLSDNGNLYNIIKVIPKTPPYFNGRFANGPVWSELLGQALKKKYNISFNDYAYGGATILSFGSSASFFSPMNLEGEIDTYYAHEFAIDKSHTLYVIWLGANDYLTEDHADGEQLTTQVIDKLAWAMNKLIADGARYFMILNVPDLSIPPLAKMSDKMERMQYLSTLHNQKLDRMLINLRNSNPNLRIFTMDVYNFLRDVISNTKRYNKQYHAHLHITDQFCWQGGIFIKSQDKLLDANHFAVKNKLQQELKTDQQLAELILKSPDLFITYSNDQLVRANPDELCKDPDEYIFWDPLHPTKIIHEILAQLASHLLETQAADLLKK